MSESELDKELARKDLIIDFLIYSIRTTMLELNEKLREHNLETFFILDTSDFLRYYTELADDYLSNKNTDTIDCDIKELNRKIHGNALEIKKVFKKYGVLNLAQLEEMLRSYYERTNNND